MDTQLTHSHPKWWFHRFLLFFVLSTGIGIPGLPSPGHTQVLPGDILVLDRDAGTADNGALFRISRVTGVRTVISDFGAGTNQGKSPSRVAVEPSGHIVVLDFSVGANLNGAVFRVDPLTGARTVVSNFGVGANQARLPAALAVEASGQILVVTGAFGSGENIRLMRVNPVSGVRTVLSDFGFKAQPLNEFALAVEASGKILFLNSEEGTGNLGALFRIDPVSGNRTRLSDFGVGANMGRSPAGVAVEASGQILVIDNDAGGGGGSGVLFRVDPVTGARTVVSSFSTGANTGENPTDVAVEASGQILAVDAEAGLQDHGILFRVDPVTGARTVLTDFSVGSPKGLSPVGVAVMPAPVFVTDLAAGTGNQGALFRVSPVNGTRTLVSDFGVGDNPGETPVGVAVEASGQVLVADSDAGTAVKGALFRVDPLSGERTLISDFGVGNNPGVNPSGITVDASGDILVADQGAGTGGNGALFRVDPVTGARTLISDFGLGANPGVDQFDVALEASGQILVIDRNAGSSGNGVLFRVDPVTGARTIASDFGAGFNPGDNPRGVVVQASGQILVIDSNTGTDNKGRLFRVNPANGSRSVVSNFGTGANQGLNPSGVALEASGQILVIDPNVGTSGGGLLFRIDPTSGVRTVLSDFGVGANRGDEPIGVAVSPLSRCGDGIVQLELGETCDDRNLDSDDGCSAVCLDESIPTACGDGMVEGTEECDDGNLINSDGCLNSCQMAACGDGFTHSGVEACDDGNADNTDACLTTCVAALCGDGFVQTGVEECDDGNPDNGDGCSALCVSEPPPPGAAHDLAVTNLIAPKTITLTAAKPVQTKPVKVQIQNRGGHAESIPDRDMLAALIDLQVISLGTCPNPVPTLVLPNKFPLTLKSKQKLIVTFDVTFDCANDRAKSTATVDHDDYSYSAIVDHSALDGGLADDHPDDDTCPRDPVLMEPNPDGKIKDTGCVEDLTDVVMK